MGTVDDDARMATDLLENAGQARTLHGAPRCCGLHVEQPQGHVRRRGVRTQVRRNEAQVLGRVVRPRDL